MSLGFVRLPRPPGPRTLTPRQQRVKELLLKGLPHKEIAYQLGIAPGTADVHASKVYHVLGVHSQVELMAAEIAHLRSATLSE